MRKWIALAFYLALVGVGLWCAYEWLVLGGKGIAFKLDAFPALFGLYMLWTDFFSPSREPI
jgi:hypothetical protein